MRNICLYFQVHQPIRLRNFRFFDIGNGTGYFDDEANGRIMRKVADKCYRPANALLLKLLKDYDGALRVSFSISGAALDQFAQFTPDVLEDFQKLVATGHVELLSETYYHSLSSVKSKPEFIRQVNQHVRTTADLFGVRPTVFRNTELIYSDEIGQIVAEMGFQGMLAEGAERVMEWRSPNHVYSSALAPGLKLLLKNYRLSDDIAFRFSDRSWSSWPLTADKFVQWLNNLPDGDEIVNLFMDYETLGEHQWKETGIFEFLQCLPATLFASSPYKFVTPSEAVSRLQPVAALNVPTPVSWADEERDLTAWLGNALQRDAFKSLYRLEEDIANCDDPIILRDWNYLQTSDHFYYMCTKFFADGDVHKYFNHYRSPYEAYINYMNVVSDLESRIRTYHAAASTRSWLHKQDSPDHQHALRSRMLHRLHPHRRGDAISHE